MYIMKPSNDNTTIHNSYSYIHSLNTIGFFTTKIFHPNVSNVGEICVNALKRDWSAELGIQHVLVVRIALK